MRYRLWNRFIIASLTFSWVVGILRWRFVEERRKRADINLSDLESAVELALLGDTREELLFQLKNSIVFSLFVKLFEVFLSFNGFLFVRLLHFIDQTLTWTKFFGRWLIKDEFPKSTSIQCHFEANRWQPSLHLLTGFCSPIELKDTKKSPALFSVKSSNFCDSSKE